MKAKTDDGIRLLVAVAGHYEKIVPAGTRGVVLECYSNPEGYIVDISIPDPNELSGYRYDCIEVAPEQFEINPEQINESIHS